MNREEYLSPLNQHLFIMTEQKIKFEAFYDVLLQVRDGKNDDEMSDAERIVYNNLKYWAIKGLNYYIKGTPLEDNSYNPPEEPNRSDLQVLEDVKYDKGISLIQFLLGVMDTNEEHHNLRAEMVERYGLEMEVVSNMSDSMRESIITELLTEFDFDIEVCLESYRGVESREEEE